MGRDHNEAGGRKARKGAQQEKPIDFWSFHPTEADKRAMVEYEKEMGTSWEVLQGLVERGIAFSLTRSKTNDSVCLVARDAAASFGEGQALSVFHSHIMRAIVGMCYVLEVVNPDWPAKPFTSGQRSLDW